MDRDRLTRPLLPGAPPLPGLRFRTYRGEADIPAIAELLRASFAANGNTEGVSEAELANAFRHSPRLRPGMDMVLGFVGERLVARSSIDWADTPDGSARYYQSWGEVHPDWRRHGIGHAMWQRNLARLRDIAAGHHFAGERLLTVPWISERDIGGLVLAERLGYRPVRTYHHMVRDSLDDIDVPPLPEGLAVRAITSADLPRLWSAMTEAFRDHFGAWDTGDASYRRWVESPTLDLSLLVVAFDGDEIAGGVHAEIQPEENAAQGYRRGWTDPVYTRRRWRRRGLAAALLGRALVRLRDRGMTSAQLDVDTQNPNQALTLYERHGFVSRRVETEWHRPLDPGA